MICFLTITQKLKVKFKLSLILYFKDKNLKRDLDNNNKVLIDCLKNKLFEDDDQIYQLYMEKYIGCGFNKICINVESIDDSQMENQIIDNNNTPLNYFRTKFITSSDIVQTNIIKSIILNIYRFKSYIFIMVLINFITDINNQNLLKDVDVLFKAFKKYSGGNYRKNLSHLSYKCEPANINIFYCYINDLLLPFHKIIFLFLINYTSVMI